MIVPARRPGRPPAAATLMPAVGGGAPRFPNAVDGGAVAR